MACFIVATVTVIDKPSVKKQAMVSGDRPVFMSRNTKNTAIKMDNKRQIVAERYAVYI